MNHLNPVQALTDTAHDIVIRNLEKYGNQLGPDHKKALHTLAAEFTSLAFGLKKGRYAYPLPTGMGKTQSIVAWCAAVHALGYKDISVTISATKVEALASLKRDLIANGVPPESIGLIHSYAYDPEKRSNPPEKYASEPSTGDNDDRPIMLVTHNRIRKGKLEQFNQYQGRPRNLLIWDESLLVSNSRFSTLKHIKKALGHLLPDLRPGDEAESFFNTAISAIDDELGRQKDGKEPKAIRLAPLDQPQFETISTQVGDAYEQEPLRQFLNMHQEPLRVAYTAQDHGLISYDITVPKELESIAILDASYPIRALEQMDSSIKPAGDFSSDIKRYDNVRIHQLRSPSGREGMTKDFMNARENRKVCNEVADLVADIPTEEGIIVFTFKTSDSGYGKRKGVDFKKLLLEDLKAKGIDVDAKVQDGDTTVQRIVLLTWGQETSLSEYSYCKHVVFAGVLHRSHLDLASGMVGQADNILHRFEPSHIMEVFNSEMAHCLYQAMSRGSCRRIEGNQAHKMDVWLIHRNEDIRPLVDQVMPGVQWMPWNGRHLVSTTKPSKVAEVILGYLRSLSADIIKLRITDLKKATGLDQTPHMSFQRGRGSALRQTKEWILEGRSLIRVSI